MTTPAILIEPKILTHPWYRKWECGELATESLRHYAGEYYWQVAHFPRYLSMTHSQLENPAQRRVILGNLLDEEGDAASKTPHPELWLDFAECLGWDRDELASSPPGPAAAALVSEFKSLVASGPGSALGAMLAYESQVPEVAQFKGKALREFYLAQAQHEKGTKFFAVHEQADVWHAAELESLIATLSPDQKQAAQESASRACLALHRFLDAMPN
jgi:pyrroloquinoline-quinone synthase